MIGRRFLAWDRPALPEAARLLAGAHEGPDGLLLEGAAVCLPGGRAGRRLLELLVEEAERRACPLVPPAILTLGALPERLYRPSRPLAGEVLAVRLWEEVLRGAPASWLARIFPHPPEPDDPAGWTALARIVHGVHRETGGEGLLFDDVAERFGGAGRSGGAVGFDDAERWKALSGLQARYLDRLAALDRGDRDRERSRALEEGRVASDRTLWLVGVVEMPGLLRRMLEALESPVHVLVHAPAERAGDFDALGCPRPDAWVETGIPLPEGMLLRSEDPEEEADAVVAALAGRDEVLPPDAVTIGVADERLVPFLEQRLGAHGVPHRHAAGRPLERTPPFRLLEALANFLGGRRFEALASLLRHPDLAPIVGGAGALDAADRYFERRMPLRAPPPDGGGGGGRTGGRAGGRAGGGGYRGLGRALARLEERLETARLAGRRSLGAWMPELLGLLERVYGERPLEPSRGSDRRLAAALEALRERAAALHALPAEADPACDAATALRLLLEEARRVSLPPPTDRPAVEMLGWLELHLDDAPVLLLTGLDDVRVPGSPEGDPFLPDALRARLGLPHDRSRHGRDAYLLTALLRAREECRIVVGRRDAEGDPRRPSRLLFAERGRELARRVRDLFGEAPSGRRRMPRPGVRTAEESAFLTPPEPVLRVEEPPLRLRVTDFRLLLQDPYRFALERILELGERHDRDRELPGSAFGSLAHGVLHRFGESEAVHSDDPAVVAARLAELLERETRRRFGSEPLPAVRLQLEQLRLRLGAFARWHASRVGEGWRVVAVELAPEEGVPFPVDERPVLLRGRIDRVEHHAATDRWSVLDYKTSDRPRNPEKTHRKGRGEEQRWVDLQLPLYRHLLTGFAGEEGTLAGIAAEGTRVELGYVNVSREPDVELALADWDAVDLASAFEAAREAVRTLREGVFRFDVGEGMPRRDDPFAALLGAGRMVSAAGGTDGGEGP